MHNFAIPILAPAITWIAANFKISIGIGICGLIFSRGLTNKEAKKQAKEWGYKETKEGKFDTHGKPKFIKGSSIISPDADEHSGGVWKEFDRKGTRKGTLDKNGNKIKN